jgi:peptide/nickel transport system ATP-binding protein
VKKPLLQIEGLRTRFHTDEGIVDAVKGIDMVLHEGETLGVVGESGSGKSVSCLSIMRLIPSPPGEIAEGHIWYEGENGRVDLLSLSSKEIRNYRGNEIAMIFQEPMSSLNPVIKCGEQVAEAIRLHKGSNKKEAKEATLELFRKVHLPRVEQIYDSYPHQLSGGQKQRVMIAMAMSCEPRILIADEPTTALDVTVQKTILELIAELQKENGMSVIFITHDLGVVADIADRVSVMYRGEVVEEGPCAEIFKDPKHPYTKGLIACRPPMGHRLKSLPTVSDFVANGSERKIYADTASFKADFELSALERSNRLKAVFDAPPILEVKGLEVHFKLKKKLFGGAAEVVRAVDGVSFHVHEGETLGLVGESGCGKTTLGRAILRLQENDGGEILFRGRELTGLNDAQMRHVRKDIQIIFQDPFGSLNPRMTIGDAILEPMKVHGLYARNERKDRVCALLERVGLQADHFKRYPHEFSGGQRQRVGIARALAVEPRFIICDESVSALDVSVQAQVLNLLNELKHDFGLTYIFISHDLSVVKFMSDRMVVMNKGKIEEMGEADAIYSDPKSEYTRKLIEAIPKGL